MALEDVLDEARWPRPKGLTLRRGPAGEELTIEVVQRAGINAVEATASVSAILSALTAHWIAAAVIVPGVAIALVTKRIATRHGEVLMSVRERQLRIGRLTIDFDRITAIESAGTLHGELWIRSGKDRVGSLNAKRVYVEFLARWLTTVVKGANQTWDPSESRWRTL